MKQKLNVATWWRYISGRKVLENAIFILWPLKWRHQAVKINICFIQTTLHFLLYHMQKNVPDIFNMLGVVRFLKFEWC